MAMPSPPPATSYWCYRCTRFVRVFALDSALLCPHCETGFLEEIETMPQPLLQPNHLRRRFPSSHRHEEERGQNPTPTSRRVRRASGDRSSLFNPVIVLRGTEADTESNTFELYYNDAAGSGLRPLPPTMSELLMGSGFDRLLEQLSQIEINGLGRPENPPASKSAVESMPVIQIADTHVGSDSHCAVCKEAFELGSEAREMPCKHIYHPDCILPWLSMRNSCPVCRHELPADQNNRNSDPGLEEETMGLTIWRLPGGGFAVGRFSGGRRPGERELPVVYTEMDGGFNGNGAPRRVLWASRSRGSESRGIRSAFRNIASFWGRLRSNSSSSRSGSESESGPGLTRSQSSSVFGRFVHRRRRAWVLDD
ncbi:hypothetical protein ACFX2I_029342 [Malus domestica]